MQTLEHALTLSPDGAEFIAPLTGDFSNAPASMPYEKGAPFGGLMAAWAGAAARAATGVTSPIRSLTVQYLAAARFEPIGFSAALGRGGRNLSYVSVQADQHDRRVLQGLVTFGLDAEGPVLTTSDPAPRPHADIEPTPLHGQFGPWFTRYVEYRFEAGPRLFGQNAGAESRLRVWIRANDDRPLDETRLIFLLDAVYPTYWTALPAPPHVSASVDLRADLVGALTPETSPHGWVFCDFVTRDLGGG